MSRKYKMEKAIRVQERGPFIDNRKNPDIDMNALVSPAISKEVMFNNSITKLEGENDRFVRFNSNVKKYESFLDVIIKRSLEINKKPTKQNEKKLNEISDWFETNSKYLETIVSTGLAEKYKKLLNQINEKLVQATDYIKIYDDIENNDINQSVIIQKIQNWNEK